MLPEDKLQVNFTEKPLATRRRASDGAEIFDVSVTGGVGNMLVPEQYDYIGPLSYDGANNLTGVVYRRGGAGGVIVATIVLTYDGANNLISVARA